MVAEEPGGGGIKVIRGVRPGKAYQRDRFHLRTVEGVQAIFFIMSWKTWVTAESKDGRRKRETGQRRVIESFPHARDYVEILPSYPIR